MVCRGPIDFTYFDSYPFIGALKRVLEEFKEYAAGVLAAERLLVLELLICYLAAGIRKVVDMVLKHFGDIVRVRHESGRLGMVRLTHSSLRVGCPVTRWCRMLVWYIRSDQLVFMK